MLILIPKTKKGKDRIRRWGNKWNILQTKNDSFLISSVNDKSGDVNKLPDSSRWIQKINDVDFEIRKEI